MVPSMPRNGLIMVDFRPSEKKCQGPPYMERNGLGNETSGSAYSPVVPGAHLYSSLLAVNRESRSEALQIYRVRLPCLVWTGKATTKEAILYLSPKRDFLHLNNTRQGSVRDTLVDFFHDLKAHDPNGVGLLNLAVDDRTLDAWDRFLKPQEIDPPPARAAFLATLVQLQRVFRIALTDLDLSYQVAFGPVRCFEIRSLRLFMDPEEPGVGVHQWHGPRGPVGKDQREELQTAIRSIRIQFEAQWSQVLVKGAVSPSREQRLVTHEPLLELWAVRDRHAWDDDGVPVSGHESEDWQGELAWVSSSGHKQEPTRSPAEVEAAFGFWLFSADAGEEVGSAFPELGLLTF